MTRQSSIRYGFVAGTDGATAPVDPRLVLYKPWHAEDQIVSVIHVKDNERFDRIKVVKFDRQREKNLPRRYNRACRQANRYFAITLRVF